MATVSNTHQQLVQLRQIYEELNFNWDSHASISSADSLVTNKVISLLTELNESCDFVTIDVSKALSFVMDLSTLRANDRVSIKVEIERRNGVFFGKNLQDLLNSHNAKYCSEVPAKGCVLVDEKWTSWIVDDSNPVIIAYLRVVKFVTFLKNEVANHNEHNEMILFGLEDTLKIPLSYSAETLEMHTGEILDSLAVINSLTEASNHQKEKAHQLKAILIDVLKNITLKDRLNFLIKELPTVSKRFAHNHELFVSGFSFDDSKELLNKENREYTVELNNVINSIHTRVIGIPLGTVFPAFLMKSANNTTTQFNFLILLSAFFMSLIISFSLFGQYKVLNKIRREYQQKWQRMKTEIPKLEKELSDEFEDLESSYKLNKRLILVFSGALVFFLIVPIEAYFKVSILEVLKNLIGHLPL